MTMPSRALRAGGGLGSAVVVREQDYRAPVSPGGLLEAVQRFDVALFPEQAHAILGGDQPHGNPLLRENLEQPNAVGRARGAGQGEHDGKDGHRPRRFGVGER